MPTTNLIGDWAARQCIDLADHSLRSLHADAAVVLATNNGELVSAHAIRGALRTKEHYALLARGLREVATMLDTMAERL